MMRLFFSLLVFLSASSKPHAQHIFLAREDSLSEAASTPTNRALAARYIIQMQQYGLVVRLQSHHRQIAAYRAAGNEKVAKRIEEKAAVNNLCLLIVFSRAFNFCPVYFMDSRYTRSLTNDSVVLMNSDFTSTRVLQLPHDSLLILDYGVLMGNEQIDNIRLKNYHKTKESNTVIGEDFLVIKNSAGQQLQKPFPFYSAVNMFQRKDIEGILPDMISETSLYHKSKLASFWGATERLNKRLIAYFYKIVQENPALLKENKLLWKQKELTAEQQRIATSALEQLKLYGSKEKQFTKQ